MERAVEIGFLGILANIQIVAARHAGTAARHAHDGRALTVILQDYRHFLRRITAVQVIIQHAGISRHTVLVEDAILRNGFRAIRENQGAARVLRLNRPHAHHVGSGTPFILFGHAFTQDCRHALLNIQGCFLPRLRHRLHGLLAPVFPAFFLCLDSGRSSSFLRHSNRRGCSHIRCHRRLSRCLYRIQRWLRHDRSILRGSIAGKHCTP